MNIGHLAPHKQHLSRGSTSADARQMFAKATRTISGVLASHPLRHLIIDPVMDAIPKQRLEPQLAALRSALKIGTITDGRIKEGGTPHQKREIGAHQVTDGATQPKEFLIKKLGMRAGAEDTFEKRVRENAKRKTSEERESILSEMRNQFGADNYWTKTFAAICAGFPPQTQLKPSDEQPVRTRAGAYFVGYLTKE